jgi:hypothetical protein
MPVFILAVLKLACCCTKQVLDNLSAALQQM